MKTRRRWMVLWIACLMPAAFAAERTLDVGAPFGTLQVYTPQGAAHSVVLFLSGDGRWNLGVVSMARHLAERGAIVVGIDTPHYLHSLAAPAGAPCRYLAADFETLSHRVQRELALPDYRVPILYGYSSGATVAYAALVQSPAGTFGGAVSMGFCPDQDFAGASLCAGSGAQLSSHPGKRGALILEPAPTLTDRWIAFQGQTDQVCPAAAVDAFAAHVGQGRVIALAHVGHGFGVESNWIEPFDQLYDELVSPPPSAPAPVTAVADLPLVELPSASDPTAPLVLMLSGDGGWAGLDRGLAAAFNARGLPVLGFSTLQYFWHARTPEQSALDIARALRHYLAQWHREQVLLVGYSFGADVLPFIVNRLPLELRARVQGVALLGLAEKASFEIRVSGWLPGSSSGDLAVRPEIAQWHDLRAVCLYGSEEHDDPCPQLAGGALAAERIEGGHHFGGDYETLARRILQHAGVGVGATH